MEDILVFISITTTKGQTKIQAKEYYKADIVEF